MSLLYPTTILFTTPNASTLSWSGDTTGTIGTGYTYKVHARNVMGEGDPGTSNTEMFGNIPAQAAISLITALAAVAIRIDWTHQGNNGYDICAYRISFGTYS